MAFSPMRAAIGLAVCAACAGAIALVARGGDGPRGSRPAATATAPARGSGPAVTAPPATGSGPAAAAPRATGSGPAAAAKPPAVGSRVLRLAAGSAPADLLRVPGLGRFRVICDRERRPFVSFQAAPGGSTVVGGIDGAADAAGARALELDPGHGLTVEPDARTITQLWTLGHLDPAAPGSATVSIASTPARGARCGIAAQATLG